MSEKVTIDGKEYALGDRLDPETKLAVSMFNPGDVGSATSPGSADAIVLWHNRDGDAPEVQHIGVNEVTLVNGGQAARMKR